MNPTTNSTPSVPESVRHYAAAHSLGEPMNIRNERTLGAAVGIGLAVFAVGLVGSLLLSAYNSAQTAAAYSGNGGTAHTFFAPTGAITLIGLAIAIRGLVIGTRTHYLYSGGLIYKRRSGMKSVTWPGISGIDTVYGREKANIAGYRVNGPHRLAITVPLKTDHPGGRDSFIDQLLGFAAHHQRPVH